MGYKKAETESPIDCATRTITAMSKVVRMIGRTEVCNDGRELSAVESRLGSLERSVRFKLSYQSHIISVAKAISTDKYLL
jgi:hypothetical protein